MLCENIKNLRKEKGLTQEELAARLGVVRQTVSKWEQGLSVPDSELLIRLSDVFDVSTGELLGETLEPKEQQTDLQQIAVKLEQLNAHLAERNARSRTLMKVGGFVLGLCAGLVILYLIFMIGMEIFLFGKVQEAASVGIIGGADGPTEIFVAGSINWFGVVVGGFLALCALGIAIILIHKSKKR